MIKIVLAFWILEMGVRGYNNTSESKCDKLYLLPTVASIVKAFIFKNLLIYGCQKNMPQYL